MNHFKTILCPVDLSDNSLAGLELATMLAMQTNAKLRFIYVAPPLLPEEAMFGGEYVRQVVEENKEIFLKLRPLDPAVGFEHVFIDGNPGPELVRASKDCDLIVMCTHGYSGVMRLLMGSVAQYLLRNAKCPVIMFKNRDFKRSETKPEASSRKFVTEVMHQVYPVHVFDKMNELLDDLNQARQSAAPVVDETGKCIGILTKTDIAKYQDLKRRFEAGDESVIDEMFEVDQYGQRRPDIDTFDQVRRHMTSPVATITNQETCDKAKEQFAQIPKIHHLVVVDDALHALGIIDRADLNQRSTPAVSAESQTSKH